MCFSAGGDRIVTTSSEDLNVHVYSIKDKAIVEKFTDSSLVVCAVSVPKPVGALITANATNVLRLRGFNTQQDKVHLDHYARSLLVCLGGQRLLAGTSKGYIHFFDINDEGVRLSTEGIQVRSNMALTCLTLAPCGQPPLVAANCMDNMVIILQANANVTNLTVQHRFSNAHRILPLRSCHVPGFGAGSLASGAEDGLVRVFDLESFSESSLKAHTVPVVDVAVSRSRALLASGDVHGRVVLPGPRAGRGGTEAEGDGGGRGLEGMANGVH
ncbi:unnamed protein product [Effrenium voratum]|nr:unnamed protein product [Effrenium voratum]